MKKALLILGIVYAGSTFCQIGKGTIFLGPGLSFSTSKDERTEVLSPNYIQTNTYRNLNLNLRLGYFITDKVAVGLVFQNAGYKGVSETKSPPAINTSTTKQSINYFGLFGRYYKMINESKIGLFGQLDLMYGLGKNTFENENNNGTIVTKTDQNTDINALRVGLAPGIVYFVTDRLAFETYFGGLSYVSQTDKHSSNGISDYENKSSDIYLNFGMNNFYLGLNFYFGGKKE
jgi:hypothetical protein